MTILISLSKPSVFLPDSMMLFIRSHSIILKHQAHVYNPSSCPTVFQHLFSAITRFIAFFLVIMPMYLCQSIQSVLSYVFHPNRGLFYQDQTNFHLHDQIQPPQTIPLIQPPSKNVHLFLTVQPFSTNLSSPKTP